MPSIHRASIARYSDARSSGVPGHIGATLRWLEAPCLRLGRHALLEMDAQSIEHVSGSATVRRPPSAFGPFVMGLRIVRVRVSSAATVPCNEGSSR